MPRQIKRSEVASVTDQIAKKQGNKCAVCGKGFTRTDYKVLDHDHNSGFIRGVLHRSCNGAEGKLRFKARLGHKGVDEYDFLIGLGKYLEHHQTPRVKLLHHSHLTEAMIREERNKKARQARARKKCQTKT